MKIMNDMVLSLELCVLLVILNLGVAFDTVDYKLLSNTFEQFFNIQDEEQACLQSYSTGRADIRAVKIDGANPDPTVLEI